MNQAILVDWALYHNNAFTQNFIEARKGQARMVLLVSSPNKDDYEPETASHLPDIEFDAVIRNTGNLTDVAFKATALSVIQDASNLVPVIALDGNRDNNLMYREGGVLITVEDL